MSHPAAIVRARRPPTPAPLSVEQVEVALLRSAVGDRSVQDALRLLTVFGPDLLDLLTAGLITAQRDVDDRGGGWWAEVEWCDLDLALRCGALRGSSRQAAAVRAAAAVSGRVPTGRRTAR